MNNECIAAGYLLGVPFVPPETGFFSDRLPNHVVTVSTCLTEVLPDLALMPYATAGDAERVRRMVAAGLSPDLLPDMLAEIERLIGSGDYEHPVFMSLAASRAFKDQFLSALNIRVLGLGLASDLVEHYVNSWPRARAGTLTCLRKRQQLVTGGTDLGYELLGEDWPGSFHSWLCCGVEPDVHERLGVQVNEFCLIDNKHLAIRRQSWPNARNGASLFRGSLGCSSPTDRTTQAAARYIDHAHICLMDAVVGA